MLLDPTGELTAHSKSLTGGDGICCLFLKSFGLDGWLFGNGRLTDLAVERSSDVVSLPARWFH